MDTRLSSFLHHDMGDITYRGMRCGLALTCLLSCAATYGQPLPPPGEYDPHAAETLWLAVVVNQRDTAHVAQVTHRDDHFYLTGNELRTVLIPHEGDDEVAVDTLDQVTTRYDAQAQRLYIDVPPAWLPTQFLATDADDKRIAPHVTPGMLVGYDVYMTHGQGTANASLWNEWRTFGTYGTFSSTGSYRQPLTGNASSAAEFSRYDTTWRLDDDEHMLRYEAGDIITRTLSWNTAVRLGGIQISRNFALRPDIVTYPLPQFTGDAAVPTAVDLFINGSRRSHRTVDPGPFVLNDVPFINGAGEATVVTTDALGREVTTTVPFYVSSDLLRQGFSDYAFAAGALRRHYGEQDFAYDTGAFSASFRYGMLNAITLQAHAEGSEHLALGGLGASVKLGNYGVLQSAYSHSRMAAEEGHQLNMGYQYTQPWFSIAVQHIERTPTFSDLSRVGTDNMSSASRRSTQITASIPLGILGNVSSGYFDIQAADGSCSRLLNISWNKALPAQSTLYVSANRALETQHWTTLAQVIMPLGSAGGSVSASLQKDASGLQTRRLDYSHTAPSEGGWGWSLGHMQRDNHPDQEQGSVTLRTRSLQLAAGTSGSQRGYNSWAEASGAVVWINDAFFASNQVSDAFMLISTDGQPNIPVRYENQLIGSTDANGHLLVPSAAAYAPGKYTLDTLGLPEDLNVPTVEKIAAVRAGSGYVLRFPIRRLKAVSVTFVDEKGSPLPMGAKAQLDHGSNAYVGWDGVAYFEDAEAQNHATVSLPGGHRCHSDFAVHAQPGSVARLGPQTCHGE